MWEMIVLLLYINYTQEGTSQVVLVIKNPSTNAGDIRDIGSILGQEDPLEEGNTPSNLFITPVFLPREFHGQRILVGYSP